MDQEKEEEMASSVPGDVGQAPSRSLPPGVAQAGSTREKACQVTDCQRACLTTFIQKVKRNVKIIAQVSYYQCDGDVLQCKSMGNPTCQSINIGTMPFWYVK